MRLSILLALCWAVLLPVHGSKRADAPERPAQTVAAFSVYNSAARKAPGDIETNLDRPEFDLSRAFDGASPNASVDLYSGALVIQAQDLFMPLE